MRTNRLLLGLVGAIGTAGCQTSETYIADDIDLTFDYSLRSGLALETHGPYVRGAEMRIWAGQTREDDPDALRGWRLQVEDPSIFQLTPLAKNGSAMGKALREGTTLIRAYDGDGEVRASEELRVLAPDRVDLIAHGPLFVGDTMDEARTTAPHILAGGTATFLARYFAGDEPLNGHGVLVAEPTDEVVAEVRQSFLFEDREWLSLTPIAPGGHAVRLLADGLDLGEVPITAVTDEDVAWVELRGDEGDDPDRGDELTVLGQAYEADGTPVYGVGFDWELDLEPIDGQGDLFVYAYTPSQVSVLEANGAGQTGTAVVHADEGRVSTSNNVGCSMTPGAARGRAGAHAALGALALLGLALLRRLAHPARGR